jgi:hypothetical protein
MLTLAWLGSLAVGLVLAGYGILRFFRPPRDRVLGAMLVSLSLGLQSWWVALAGMAALKLYVLGQDP